MTFTDVQVFLNNNLQYKLTQFCLQCAFGQWPLNSINAAK